MNVGILGGGQLGRMLALAGYPLGLRFRFLEPQSPAPVDGLGEVVRAAYDDPDAVRRFAQGLDVVTYEFENVPDSTARLLEELLPVYPSAAALRTAQDRLAEKTAFEHLGIPTPVFHPVDSRDHLEEAIGHVGLPAVLKTRRLGYDGKGQAMIPGPTQVEEAWTALAGPPLLLERFIPFTRELSIVGARGTDGDIVFYPLVENEHRGGILYRTIAPAPLVSAAHQEQAQRHLRALMEAMGFVGVLALELFQKGDELLANEMAPRVHNSGHWTQDGARTSQFENHLRAVCGFALGDPAPHGYAGMLNLIGALPAREAVLAIPGARLHLYDKEPRPGRKLGHVNASGADPGEVRSILDRVEALLPEG
ncbi:MAG: 5-(carboxyamino)imidazole ribonucleotide synthase [Myxococcales bacterium]|nr:5-(carboxyamino)imidazole ribonucleotide synthase [Myxococcales bacterium]